MARICPQCSQENPDSMVFCTRCGSRLPDSEEAGTNDATVRQSSLANVDSQADPGETLPSSGKRSNAPSAPLSTPQAYAAPQAVPAEVPSYSAPQSAPLPATPGYSAPQSAPLPATPSYQPTQFAHQPFGQGQVPQSGFLPPAQQSAYQPQPAYGQQPYAAAQQPGSGLASLQRAFAGRGTPVHHQSWLLDNKHESQPAMLRNILFGQLQKQGVLGLTVHGERLREHSTGIEERDYIKAQYGVSSVLVYFAPMGSNLYISRTSAVQQPYSRVRQFVLLGLGILMLISLLLFALINPTYEGADNPGGYGFGLELKTIFEYAFIGLLFFFIYLLIRSFISWLTDRDFFAYLRPNQLNDFTLDALSSIELVTDKAIRETIKQAGLNANEFTPPTHSYELSQPLRRI